jgi:hypothetical protein
LKVETDIIASIAASPTGLSFLYSLIVRIPLITLCDIPVIRQ